MSMILPEEVSARMVTLPTAFELSLEAKIGQLLCLGWSGPNCLLNINEQARRCIDELQAGAMIIMGRNISPEGGPLSPIDAPAVQDMLSELQSLSNLPLLLSTDQEGGRVARFGSTPFTRMPEAEAIGTTNNSQLAGEAARITALELAAVGINWNFAPVADVNSNPYNPVIGDRSFGTTVEGVAPLVAAQVRGYLDGGVLPCAKHFPGHGDTAEDSHFALPTLPYDLAQMRQRELIPFRAAIDAGVPTMMTAHILFPALDSKLPATMSTALLTGLLREELGFSGLLVTDCLEMKAIADHWGTAKGAVLAIKAGADMVMVCHTWKRQQETRDALLQAVNCGELPIERVNEAVSRILTAKKRAFSVPLPQLSVIGLPEHKALRQRFVYRPLPQIASALGAEAPQ
jgi:beta-N-acetylhexosaminidase